jgi:hypothetical protein
MKYISPRPYAVPTLGQPSCDSVRPWEAGLNLYLILEAVL